MIELWVPGKPRGKDRPRFSKKTGRTFTTQETRDAEASIVTAWYQDGAIMLDDNAVSIYLEIRVERPQSHYRTNGKLSAEGLRCVFPIKQKPDIDNCLKLVMDALNKRAYTDDVRVTEVTARRVWADKQGLLIRIMPLVNG